MHKREDRAKDEKKFFQKHSSSFSSAAKPAPLFQAPKLCDYVLPAEQLLRGDVLHPDVIVISPGYHDIWGCIDHDLEYGQVRRLDPDVVKMRVKELMDNPPGAPIRLTVWMEPGVYPLTECPGGISQCGVAFCDNFIFSLFCAHITASNMYYVLSGQHIFSAAQQVSTGRAKAHLPVFKCVRLLNGDGKWWQGLVDESCNGPQVVQ